MQLCGLKVSKHNAAARAHYAENTRHSRAVQQKKRSIRVTHYSISGLWSHAFLWWKWLTLQSAGAVRTEDRVSLAVGMDLDLNILRFTAFGITKGKKDFVLSTSNCL